MFSDKSRPPEADQVSKYRRPPTKKVKTPVSRPKNTARAKGNSPKKGKGRRIPIRKHAPIPPKKRDESMQDTRFVVPPTFSPPVLTGRPFLPPLPTAAGDRRRRCRPALPDCLPPAPACAASSHGGTLCVAAAGYSCPISAPVSELFYAFFRRLSIPGTLPQQLALGIDDISPIQIAPVQAQHQHLRRGYVGGIGHVVLVAQPGNIQKVLVHGGVLGVYKE